MVTDTFMNPMSQQLETSGGFIYTGMPPTGPGTMPSFGIPYNLHADSLTGFYKYAQVGTDSFNVVVFITKWNPQTNMRDTLSRNMKNGAASANYTKFFMPILYMNQTDIGDSIFVQVSSSDRPLAQIGSTLIFDDIMLYLPCEI